MNRSSAKRLSTFIVSVGACLFLSAVSLFGSEKSAQASGQASTVTHPARIVHPVKFAKTQPMRDFKFVGPLNPGPPRVVRNEVVPKTSQGSRPTTDPVLQNRFGITQPGELSQFDGGDAQANYPLVGTTYAPPDTNGDVGLTQYIQYLNVFWVVFDKTTGAVVFGPTVGNSFWQGLTGSNCANQNDGDPIVKYDRQADRWIFTQFAVEGPGYHQCIAVSETNDPTGSYFAYDYLILPDVFIDYPKMGIWPDGYYMTWNGYPDAGGFEADAGAFDRTAMLAGDPTAQAVIFSNYGGPNDGGVLPSDLDGSTAPPVGSPNFLVDWADSTTLDLFRFHVDWVTPANSTMTGPIPITVDPFIFPVCGSFRDQCVPQLGSSELLETLVGDMMYRLPYRNFVDHEAIVGNFTVGTPGGSAAIRWFELRDPNGTPTLYQEGTYAPDDSYRWMGSIGMDTNGNMALGYSKSDATIHPSIAITGRLAIDPLNTMGSEDVFLAGAGSQVDTFSRWGDYSSMSIDPTDDCTFWYTTEYYAATGSFDWKTRVGSFKFPSCSTGPTGMIHGTVTDGTNPLSGVTVKAGTASALTNASGAYSFTLPVSPPNYDMTASKYGFLPGSALGIVVTDGGDVQQDFVLSPAPSIAINGVVKDGSGGGWPLYAKVVITGPGAPTFTLYTDPVNGYYSQTLVAGLSYTFQVNAVSPGYQQGGGVVPLSPAILGPNATVLNWSLLVDLEACNAPGYGLDRAGLYEPFDAGIVPPGWTVINDSTGGNGIYPTEWVVVSGSDPCGDYSGNMTGGSGPYAVANSDCPGSTVLMDTTLISPSVDMSSINPASLQFNEDYLALGDEADVDISADDGATWTNVLAQTSSARGPRLVNIDITSLASGHSAVKARFHYYNAAFAWWWQVDNVQLGSATCDARSGGLVVGNVFDANDGSGLNGATVENLTNGGSTKTVATPDNPFAPDGFYILFSESGTNTFKATLTNYGPDSHTNVVVPNSTVRQDFVLQSGHVSAAPSALNARVNPSGTQDLTLTLSNSGGAPASFEILEINAPVLLNHTSGFASRMTPEAVRARLPQDHRLMTSGKDLPPLPNAPKNLGRPLAAGDVLGSFPTDIASPWGVGYSGAQNATWLTNIALLAGDDKDYQYLADGSKTGADDRQSVGVSGRLPGGRRVQFEYRHDLVRKSQRHSRPLHLRG